MEPCPPPLVDDPYTSGFTSEEVDSGYAEYVTTDAPSCMADPRGVVSVVGRFRGRPELPSGGSDPGHADSGSSKRG